MSADNSPASKPTEDEGDETLLRRTMRPHRSLSDKGRARLLTFFGLAGIAVSIPFYLMGAWPVVGFFGLDVALLALAFRANTRAARAREELALSHVALDLSKISARGETRHWRFNPSWVRLQTERHEEFGTQRIALREGRREVEIGAFLGAEQKDELAKSVAAALGEAKRGRRYDA